MLSFKVITTHSVELSKTLYNHPSSLQSSIIKKRRIFAQWYFVSIVAVSQDDAVLPVVDWSPFQEEEVFKLGRVENWPKLRQILAAVINKKFRVTDAPSQALVDGARIILDSSHGDIDLVDAGVLKNRYVVRIVLGHEGNEDEAVQVMELLLAAGVNPDKTVAANDPRSPIASK